MEVKNCNLKFQKNPRNFVLNLSASSVHLHCNPLFLSLAHAYTTHILCYFRNLFGKECEWIKDCLKNSTTSLPVKTEVGEGSRKIKQEDHPDETKPKSKCLMNVTLMRGIRTSLTKTINIAVKGSTLSY